MDALRAGNLAVKFLLELAALAGLAIGGWQLHPLLGVVAPVAMMVTWGRWCAPRAAHRLGVRSRIPLEMSIFGVAALGWWLAGFITASLVFAAVIVVNAALLTIWRQWDR